MATPFSRRRVFLLLAATLAASPVCAQAPPGPWSGTLYLQQSWPKQTETNQQIKDINATFGAAFKTWDDVANLNLGLKVFRELSPKWKVGFELDYSQGKIDGSATVDSLAGPATLAFEQKYTVFGDLLAVAHYRPLGATGNWIPFLVLGLGYAYEKDRTTLSLRNSLLEEGLRVDNSGWFPLATAGVGLEIVLLPQRRWYVECGVSYSWARLKQTVSASGSLAPAPTVTADTDSTGPNAWLGIGRRF